MIRWIVRILFFPLWIFFIFRRARREEQERWLKNNPTVEAKTIPPEICYICSGCGSEIKDNSIKLCTKCKGTGKIFFWFKEPIDALDEGHLFNIIEAMNRGTWLKTGNSVKIQPDLRYALRKEAKKRKWNVKQKVGFRQRNIRYKVGKDLEESVNKPTAYFESKKYPWFRKDIIDDD